MHRLDLIPSNEEISKFRFVFGQKNGPDVLAMILFHLGFDDESSNDPESVACRNIATWLLQVLGGGEIKQQAIKNFCSELMKQALPEDKKEE